MDFLRNRFEKHCVKSVHIRSFFWSVFSRIRPEYGEIRIEYGLSLRTHPNTGKYGPEKTPYVDIFHAMKNLRHGQSMDSDAIALNFSQKLDSTDCSMRVL